MATLVSPGVSVSVINESFFIPASAPTVPLFFIATRSGKTQQNGITPASGTLEANVIRTVTSRTQALELYGVPHFRNDISGNEYHGDARNEYGLLALHQFLDIGNRAYVVRANIDLADEPRTFMSLGSPVLQPGSVTFSGIGNGTISGIVGASAQAEPQTITVTFQTPTTFSVTGSLSGYIGAGSAGSSFTSTTVEFSISNGLVPFSVGDKFMFQLVYGGVPEVTNVGNGRLNGLVPDTLAVDETFTITFTSPTSYTVTGTVSGPAGSGVVGSPFDNNRLNFTVVAGTVAFATGDAFTVDVNPVTITSPLGANDAAKRVAIVTALQAAINSNTEVRSPLYEFNLLLCPGYHEVADELIALSTAVKEEALVIADTPVDKTPEQVAQWSLTSERQRSTNAAYYYPWCLMSNLDGRNVLGAPSGTALKTIAYSDTVAFVWTAPAGVSRGLVTGVSRVGYITGTPGTATTFVEVSLNEGQRDNLYEYDKNINPIVFFPGRGLLIWGQKTSASAASALDRVNVVRLVMYLRRALRKGAIPFVFEPNDQITRDNLKAAADSIMSDILAKRGLTDFASYCDENNNTPDRIDRNELYLDVAIKPTKAAEFIYIPIRVVNTGAEI
jgi:phage tail sheath protein FI